MHCEYQSRPIIPNDPNSGWRFVEIWLWLAKMKAKSVENLTLQTADAADRARALWIVFHDEAEDSRPDMVRTAIDSTERDPQALEGLVIAKRGRSPVGAAWGQITGGNTAMLFPPRLLEDEPFETATLLMNWIDEYLARRRVPLHQALVTIDHKTDDVLLSSAGFFHASDLTYLACPSERFPSEGVLAEPVLNEQLSSDSRDRTLDFERFAPTDRQRLRAILEGGEREL